MTDTPRLFRLNIEVGDLAAAKRFYEMLFAAPARLQPGNRFYLDVGAVALQVVGVPAPHPAAKALYFSSGDLDAVHARAGSLQALSTDVVHGLKAAEITTKPWGERSFYAVDPWGNPLCFVAAGTEYAG